MAIAIEAAELMEHFMWIEDSKAAEALLEKKEMKLKRKWQIFWRICFHSVPATT